VTNQKVAKKMDKCVFSWPAQLKNGQIFRKMANLATLAQFAPLPAEASCETCWRIVVLLVFIA